MSVFKYVFNFFVEIFTHLFEITKNFCFIVLLVGVVIFDFYRYLWNCNKATKLAWIAVFGTAFYITSNMTPSKGGACLTDEELAEMHEDYELDPPTEPPPPPPIPTQRVPPPPPDEGLPLMVVRVDHY